MQLLTYLVIIINLSNSKSMFNHRNLGETIGTQTSKEKINEIQQTENEQNILNLKNKIKKNKLKEIIYENKIETFRYKEELSTQQQNLDEMVVKINDINNQIDEHLLYLGYKIIENFDTNNQNKKENGKFIVDIVNYTIFYKMHLKKNIVYNTSLNYKLKQNIDDIIEDLNNFEKKILNEEDHKDNNKINIIKLIQESYKNSKKLFENLKLMKSTNDKLKDLKININEQYTNKINVLKEDNKELESLLTVYKNK